MGERWRRSTRSQGGGEARTGTKAEGGMERGGRRNREEDARYSVEDGEGGDGGEGG